MRIASAGPDDLDAIMPLMQGLWPEYTAKELTDPLETRIFGPDPTGTILLAWSGQDEAVGFAEVMVRTDYVNGCESSPVAFLEGIYVDPACRRKGVARMLAAAAQAWGRERGCREFASDALIDNLDSHDFHRAIGFAETERVVYFRMPSDVETQS